VSKKNLEDNRQRLLAIANGDRCIPILQMAISRAGGAYRASLVQEEILLYYLPRLSLLPQIDPASVENISAQVGCSHGAKL
jgi:hypothetical protein